MRTRNPSSGKRLQNQRGAVLIVSLAILIAMTLIGITAVSVTTLEERMARNFQQSELNFQAAESVIQTVMNAGSPDPVTGVLPANNPFQNLIALGVGNSSTADVNTTVGNIGIATNRVVTLQSSGGLCPGESSSTQCHVLDIQATATIAATGATRTHIQRVRVKTPAPE